MFRVRCAILYLPIESAASSRSAESAASPRPIIVLRYRLQHDLIVQVNDAAEFFERGDALQNFYRAVLRHAADLLVSRGVPDVALARGVPHALLDLFVHENHLDDRDTTLIANAATLLAALRNPHRLPILRNIFRMRDFS